MLKVMETDAHALRMWHCCYMGGCFNPVFVLLLHDLQERAELEQMRMEFDAQLHAARNEVAKAQVPSYSVTACMLC